MTTILALFAVAAPSWGALQEPFLAQANGKPIQLNVGHAAPMLTDFDGDGKRDLLVGEFGGGGIRFYKNHGSSAQPEFRDFAMVEADGKPIRVEAG